MEETIAPATPVVDTPPAVDPGNAKLKKFHESLVKEHAAVPLDYGQFEKALQDPDKAKKFHESLVKEGFAVPVDYDKFSTALDLGVKKKEDTVAPSPEGSEVSAPIGSTTPPVSDLQTSIEQALKQNPDAHPEFDASLVSPQGLVPKDVLEKNYKDHEFRAHLEDEYKKALDDHTPLMTHVAGKFNQAIVDAAASIPKTVAIVSKALDDKLGTAGLLGEGDKRNVEEYATYKAGQWIQDTAKALGITKSNPAMEQDFWASAVPNGMGSVASIVMSGLGRTAGTAALKMMGRESYITATKDVVKTLAHPSFVTGGTMMGVPEFEAAKKAGASDDDAFKVFLQNYVIGQTDALPIGRALERINKLTGNSVVNVLKNATVGGTEELIQESVQQYLTNVVAKDYYDKSRDLFDGLAQNAEAGFVVGFLFSAIAGGAARLPKQEREKVDKFIAEKEKEYHQAYGGEVTADHITPAAQPESQIVAPTGDLGKQPTIKPQEDAVRQRIPEKVDVGQAPADSKEVEQGVPGPRTEKPANAQGGQEVSTPQNKPEVPTSERPGGESQIKVHAQPVQAINVDRERFQNRDEAYSKKSVNNIVNAVIEGNFQIKDFDPIRTWKDPGSKKTFVLSGHSRTAAFQQLQSMLEKGEIPKEAMEKMKAQGVEDFKHIPAIDVSGKTEKQAIDFAQASNTLATQESDLERAKLIKKKREEGQSMASIRKETKSTRGQELLSHLKPGGEVWDSIKAVEGSETVENKRRVLQVGEFIGAARNNFPQLNDSQENEMFKYLTKGKGQNISTREDFLNRIDNVVNNIAFQAEPNQPLNLDNRVTRGSNESEAVQARDEILRNIKELERERENKTKPPAEGRLNEISREIATLNKNLVTATQNIDKAKAGDKQQTDLFGAQIQNQPESDKGVQGNPTSTPEAKSVDSKKSTPGEVATKGQPSAETSSSIPVSPEGKQKLFVYGTLKDAATRKKAIGEHVEATADNVPGAGVEDIASFPEIEQEANSDLKGDVLEVTPEQLAKLDQWEEKYERSTVTLASGEKAFVYKLKPEALAELKAKQNEPGTTSDLESDRARTAPAEQVGTENVPKERKTDSSSAEKRKPAAPEAELRGESGGSVSNRIPPTDGNPPDTGLSGSERITGVTERPGRGDDGSGSGATDEPGVQAKPNTAKHPERSTHAEGTSGLNIERKLELQRQAESTAVLTKDKANILATLPILLPHQADNVLKAENRFFNPAKENEPNKGILFTDGTGTGKSQPLSARVLTPNGWTTMGLLMVGSKIITELGEESTVTGIYPQGVLSIFEITFSDGAKTRASGDHLWMTQTLKQRRHSSKGLPLRNFRKRIDKDRYLPSVKTTLEILNSLDRRHFIPVPKPIIFSAKKLFIHPYVLGVLIGDGNLTGGRATFATKDSHIVRLVDSFLPIGCSVKRIKTGDRCEAYAIYGANSKNRNKKGHFGKSEIIDELKHQGLFGLKAIRKHIPSDYLLGSVEQRMWMLRGLLDTDGTVGRGGCASYSTSSPELRDDFISLVRSLGGTANYGIKKTYRHQNYIVHLNLPIDIIPFCLHRKLFRYRNEYKYSPKRAIVSIVPVGQDLCQCISVSNPSKLYVTDDYVVTHNTYTGLGIAKRFVKSGKKNILIVVPTETKAQDWVGDGKNLFLDIEQLPDTQSAGKEGSQVTTTYANFRANEALQKRKFDLVIYDESHKLVSNEAGDQTEADKQHKELTNSPNVANRKAREAFQSQIDKDMKEGFRISEKTKDLINKEAHRLMEQTKVVFLSATPFAYHKNLRYADGYLFTIQEGVKADGSRGYNQPSPEQAFFIRNFGYRMHYNKLTVPETGVDQSLMERMFHSSLIKSGAVSSHKLQLDKDYSREFVLIDDRLGLDIDEGVKIASDTKKYRFLPAIIAKKFNYLYQNQLLEAMKAKNVVDRIKQHTKLGRKVVVFHSYVNSLPNHPFDLDATDISYQNERDRRVAEKEINDFHNEYPQYRALDLRGLINPVQTMQNAFGKDLLIFNGTVPAGKRKAAIRDFNTDGSGKDILVVQIESGKEGISLHDVTGKHQRAEIHLELPTRPTDAIQSEGRVYRIGQMSDAIIEYAVLHLDFEKLAFANKINTRVKTAENLAFGEEARNLEDAFKEGYKAPNQEQPRADQGIGGKESDASFESIDQFDKAKSFYYGRGKRTAKTKAREGKDYYATPEPLGLKMVEWLQPKPNDHLLEPSAGHGAIARWFPGDTVNKFIEQSAELRPDLAINSTGELLTERNFEDLHAVNKFHGIAMNPPFGHAGKTAWDHVVKALDHLKDGGRVVAIVPQGGSMEKRISDWQEGEDSKNYFIRSRIKLPSVTFERAGTSVSSEILIIDKIENAEQQELIPQTQNRDWSRFEKIENFFDHLREQEVPDRVIPRKDVAQILTEGGRSTVIGVVKKESSEVGDFEVVAGKHTKTGVDIHTVKMNKRLTTEEYARAKSKASELGGYYSSYRGSGATPGFIFKTSDAAKRLLDFLYGNEQDAPSTWNNEPEGYLNMASNPSKGKTPLSAFETRVFNQEGKPFKMYQRVIDLARKYNPESTLGQNNTARGNEGTFYTPSGNIRIKGLSDLSVAMHEIVHALDFNYNVIKDFMKGTTPANPLRKGLSQVFKEYYPGASPSADLRKRMLEGYATLMEKYLINPTEIKAKYPLLVKEFISPTGKYSFSHMQNFLNEVDEVIKMYQALDPLSKIGTRVVDQRIDDDQQGYLTKTDLATRELFDALWPIEKLAKDQGTQMTSEDTSLWIRLANNAAQIAQKNISSKKNEFWTMDDKGEWSKKLDFNLNTIIRGLEKRGLTSQFGNYLVGRRIHFQYEKRNELQDKLDKISNNPVNPQAGDQYEEKLQNQFGISAADATAMADKQRADFQDQIEYIQAILDNDGFSETEASEAYNAGNVIFKQDEDMYDAITKENLDFAHNPLVQLIDDESYTEMSKNKGYAPMKRQQYDELVGNTDVPSSGVTVGKTRVSSFIQRKGSQKPIINPLVGAMTNHAEIIRKGMKQMVYNKFLDVVKHNPTLFQKLPLVTTPDPKNRYPQEKDPNIIMAREGGKRVPILASKEIKLVLDENFQYHNMHMLEHVGVSMSQAFRTGTTGIFWQFFINNTFLDQFAAGVNTRNGLFPFLSGAREVSQALLDPKSKEAAYLKEYLFLAGSSQTFLSADITSRKNLEERVFGEKQGYGQKVTNMFDFVVKILSAPGNATEIMTRFTEYSLARKAGKPQIVALEEAGRVSTPFHHMGRFGRPLGRSYVRSVPYFNSSLQVLRQSKRTLGTKEGRTRYAFAALSMIAAAAATTLHFLDKDDEDQQKQILKTLTPDEMSKHLYFPNPYSDKRLLQVRIPEQLGWLSALTMMSLIQGAKQTNYKWSEFGEAGASFMPTQMNPFNITQMLMSYAPPLPRTTVETMAGFKSYPNIRPIETEHDKHLPAELRYNAFTSPVAVELGELAGWSPKKIDHFLEGTFGRSIKYLTGKPGAYGIGQIFTKELYLEASRQVQFYFNVKERNARMLKAHEDGLKEYSKAEVEKLNQRDFVLDDIEGAMEEFRDTDARKEPMKATRLRNEIFTLIRKLENLEE